MHIQSKQSNTFLFKGTIKSKDKRFISDKQLDRVSLNTNYQFNPLASEKMSFTGIIKSIWGNKNDDPYEWNKRYHYQNNILNNFKYKLSEKLNTPPSSIYSLSDANLIDSDYIFNYIYPKRTLAINTEKLPDFINKKSLDKAIDYSNRLVTTVDRLGPKIYDIYYKTAEKLGIEEKFIPQLAFTYDNNTNYGQNGNTTIYFNAFMLENAYCPEYIISNILAHELSHHKTDLLYSLININDLPDVFKNNKKQFYLDLISYMNYRSSDFKSSIKKSGLYDKIKSNYIRYLRGCQKLKSKINYNNMLQFYSKLKWDLFLSEVSKKCDLKQREILAINLKDLQEGKGVTLDNSVFYLLSLASFSPEELETIRLKVQKNLPIIKRLCSKYNMKNVIEVIGKNYLNSKDEALAFYNGLRITKENIKDNTVEITDKKLLQQIIDMPLINLKDYDFRDIHSSFILRK